MASKNKKLSSAVELFEQDIGGAIRKINLSEISPASDQPRQAKDIRIENLAQSLQAEGLLQPIVVTKKENRYVIIAGERRYRAAVMLGWRDIECRILHKEDKDRFRLAVIENLQRENLSAFDEASSYKRLKIEFNYTDGELSNIIGKSRNYINEILTIDEIPLEIKKKAEDLQINNTNLLIQLASAHKNNFAEQFLESFRTGQINNVRNAKEFVKEQKNQIHRKTDSQQDSNLQVSIEYHESSTGTEIKIFLKNKQLNEKNKKNLQEKIQSLLKKNVHE